jgi:hypothetical protein
MENFASTEPYRLEYNNFMANYKSGVTGAEQIGLLHGHMAQYFSDMNERKHSAEQAYNKVVLNCEQSTDVNNKPLSSAKAQAMAMASDEYNAYNYAKIHLENIDQIITALKAMQWAVLKEYSHMGNS